MSKFLEGSGLFEEAESKEVSLNSSKNNSLIKSKEIEYDPNKMIFEKTRYEEPKYQEVKNTYEVLKPITKQVMELPIQTKKKIKTTKTIYQKEIIVENEEELNKILNGDDDYIEEIPLPTKSTIQNLIKDSIVVSNTTSSKEQSNIFKSQKLKSENILLNNKNNNDVNDVIKSQVNIATNKLKLKNDINNNKYNNNIYLSQANNNNKIKIKNSQNSGAFEQQCNIEYKNKNYIETYFHDDDIPKPEVCEGNGLEFSDMKNPNEENNKIKKSRDSNNSNNQIKDLLDNLPIEHTVLLPNQPKVDISKIQKDNMMNKSNITEISKTINSHNQAINNNKEKKFYYKSQALNINNNYNNNKYNNNIDINKSMKNNNKNIIINNNNELPIPEMDINNYNINNNNYGNENKNKIKPKMELYNKNKNNIDNKSKVSFPSSSSGGSLMSQTSVTEKYYQNNNKNKK